MPVIKVIVIFIRENERGVCMAKVETTKIAGGKKGEKALINRGTENFFYREELYRRGTSFSRTV